jgi:site-specific recombinase XerD
MNIFDKNAANSSESALKKLALANVIDSYLSYYAASSSHTARAKQIDLMRFLHFMAKIEGCAAEKVRIASWNYSSVQRFVEHLLKSGEAPATVSRRLATLKHMGRTLAEKLPGFINPARDVKAPKMQATMPKALSFDEMSAVRQAASKRVRERPSFIRSRNLMLLELLLETGLRAEEIRLLKFGQLDDKIEWISQVRTKGRKFRNVYIASSVRSALKAYLEQRSQELKRFYPTLSTSQNRKLPVFISTYAAKATEVESFFMGAKTLWRSINQLSQELKLHPHLLRHSFAVDLLESSNDIRLVSQALGHSDVRVTMRYTERRDAEIAKALERKKR